MMNWYDRDGNPISMAESGKLSRDEGYKLVARHTYPDGRWVSTVWLGLDHNFGDGPPLIFETMVFPELDCERYTTLEEAKEGHKRMVEKWAKEGNK